MRELDTYTAALLVEVLGPDIDLLEAWSDAARAASLAARRAKMRGADWQQAGRDAYFIRKGVPVEPGVHKVAPKWWRASGSAPIHGEDVMTGLAVPHDIEVRGYGRSATTARRAARRNAEARARRAPELAPYMLTAGRRAFGARA